MWQAYHLLRWQGWLVLVEPTGHVLRGLRKAKMMPLHDLTSPSTTLSHNWNRGQFNIHMSENVGRKHIQQHRAGLQQGNSVLES